VNPYEQFVGDFVRLFQRGHSYPLGGVLAGKAAAAAATDAPRVLLFSPHPDDEVIIGGLALRLQRQLGWRVVNVAVTQGSNALRREERWQELRACCLQIGFDLLATAPGGLAGISLSARSASPDQWRASVAKVTEILQEHSPRVILFPHDDDWNATHIGTHHLVVEALQACAPGFTCVAVETEFWGAMRTPNLMVESSEHDVADLITALSFHAGEVKRNPYHLRMPAWLMDNVRRGSELVGGQGTAAPDFMFATLYRVRRWHAGAFEPMWGGGRFLGRTEDPATLFE
jgi:LmbE family N-acetylglucosaminyl deacetylase